MAREIDHTTILFGDMITGNFALRQAWKDSGLTIEEFQRQLHRQAFALNGIAAAQDRAEAAIARTREGLLTAEPAHLEFAGATDLSNQSTLEFTTGIAQLLTYTGRYRIALQSIGDELPDTVIGTEALIPPTLQLANDFSVLGDEAAGAAVEVRNLNNAITEGASGAGFEGQESLLFGEGPAAGADLARARAAVEARRTSAGRGGGGGTGGGPSDGQIADLERARDLGDEFGARWAAAYALVQQAQSSYNESLNQDFDLNVAVVDARERLEPIEERLEAAQESLTEARADDFELAVQIRQARESLQPFEDRLADAQQSLNEARRSDFRLARAVTRARQELLDVERGINEATRPFTDRETEIRNELAILDIAEAEQELAAATGRERLEADLRLQGLRIDQVRAARADDVASAQARIAEAEDARSTEIAARQQIVQERQDALAGARERVKTEIEGLQAALDLEIERRETLVETIEIEQEAAEAEIEAAEVALEMEQERRRNALAFAGEQLTLIETRIQLQDFLGEIADDDGRRTISQLQEQVRLQESIAALEGRTFTRSDLGFSQAARQGLEARAREFLGSDSLDIPAARPGEPGSGTTINVTNNGTIVTREQFKDLFVQIFHEVSGEERIG